MRKEELSKYVTYKKRVEKLYSDISELEERDIETVAGKVKGSMKEHPYTERRFSVQMEVPEAAERISKQISKKEKEIKELEARMREIEKFIDDIEDAQIKNIFEYRYLKGMTCKAVGKEIGYTHGRISQVILRYLQQENSNSKLWI